VKRKKKEKPMAPELGDGLQKKYVRRKQQMKSPMFLELSRANVIAAIESWITPFKGIPRGFEITNIEFKDETVRLKLEEKEEALPKVEFYGT
jgi:hypothetical protein